MNISAGSSLPMQPMDYWEFLLQKEGDRSWLPLDSPNVEILEGRYRVVARSNRPHTAVEIRVTHLATTETPPKRRAQRRPGVTNAAGLMVVAPYTVLKPGIWELSCFGDVMSDLMGEGWRYTVQLQVLAHDSETEDDWEANWQSSSDQTHVTDLAQPPQLATHSAIEQLAQESESAIPPATPSPDRSPSPVLTAINPLLQEAAQLSQQIADDMIAEFDAAVGADTEAIVERSLSSQLPAEPLPLGVESAAHLPSIQIVLHQETYVAHRGEHLTLFGQLVTAQPGASSSPVWIASVDRVISLRDPQSSQVLLHIRETLPAQSLPIDFVCDLVLPMELSTQLMLGEVTLSPVGQADQTVLASQPFTVISALNELLEAIADEAVSAEDALNLTDQPELQPDGEASLSSGLNLSYLNLISEPKPLTSQQFSVMPGQPLPPQIYQPTSPAEASQKSIKLPSFAPISSPEVPPELSPIAEATEALTEETIVPESLSQSTVDESSVSSEPLSIQLLSPPDDISLPFNEDSLADLPAVTALQESQTYPIQDEFQALNLQHRFLSRLSALATDAELSEELKESLPESERFPQPEAVTAEVEGATDAATSEAEALTEALAELPLPVTPEADLLAREVVVDDPAELESRVAARLNRQKSLANTLPPEMVLPADELVPTPILTLPRGELVAGKALLVQVKIPNLLPRIYVKLWINDRQTRSLLEGPRWLMDFAPDGLGDQEAATELIVPFGSIEVAIEAIAVEMSTQRESHKVTIDRPVVPANLPNLELENF